MSYQFPAFQPGGKKARFGSAAAITIPARAILLSTFTFASVFYHDTESVASSADSNIPLSLWEMVTSRVVMMAIFLISVSCLFAMHATLTRLCCLPPDCYLKTMLLDLPAQEGESQSANGD